MAQKTNNEANIAVIQNSITYIQKDVSEIKADIKALGGVYLTRMEFDDFKTGDFATIKRGFYGAIGVIFMVIVGVLVYFFTHK